MYYFNSRTLYSSQNGERWHCSELAHAVVPHGLEFMPCFQIISNHLWYTALQAQKALAAGILHLHSL